MVCCRLGYTTILSARHGRSGRREEPGYQEGGGNFGLRHIMAVMAEGVGVFGVTPSAAGHFSAALTRASIWPERTDAHAGLQGIRVAGWTARWEGRAIAGLFIG